MVVISAEVLRQHLDYSAWASARLFDAASQLSGDELVRDFGTADKSVMGTLVHVFGADRAWLARVHGDSSVLRPGPELFDPAALREAWDGVHRGWREWAAALSEEEALTALSYHDFKGRPWQTPLWQVVLHVVNHATHHRGQAAGFLRTLGHVPPALDLIAFYRGL
jgi:uncharacterized damage-inducible protein DinB